MSGSTRVNNYDATGEFPSQEPCLTDRDNEAIEIFERAIEKEAHGLMSDAVKLYREAFKLNDQVDFLYRKKKLPHHVNQLKEEGGKNTTQKVDEEKVKQINVDQLLESFSHTEAQAPDPNDADTFTNEDKMTIKFEKLGMDDELNGHIDIEPVSPLMHLTNDIWIYILEILLITSPEAWFNFSITCKKNAYLGLGSTNMWRKLCYLIYPNQNYYENQLYLENNQTTGNDVKLVKLSLPIPLDQLQIVPQYNMSWKYMIHNRPFLKFHGCYISVINYYSEGGKAEFSNSWSNPVRTITYYRYLRFYPDGTCVKVLSTLEPNKVIPYLLKYNSLKSVRDNLNHELKNVANQPRDKDKGHSIYHGKWTLSLNNEVHVKVDEGSAPYYTFHYHFEIKPLGGIYKHNKLKWLKFYAVRKKTSENDDREGEEATFSLKKENAFKYLRVKSFHPSN